uniref:ADP-ribosyl cyclase/cyclic ADP-ribose hydrolase n=1 Tax=Cyclopterus lumpus TaxID=8103 RepID=A0A8C2XAQ9_CYCLU
MSSSPTSGYSVMINVTAWLIVCLLCPVQPRAQPGTTSNIKHIVVGRCYDYITLVNPGLRLDCEDIWRLFEESVVRQSSFNTSLDYHQMFSAIPQTWPRDMGLFWSKTRTLMHSYTAVERHFWTLEDTLVGYMFNGLVWCGQEDDSGFNFRSCPTWAEVKHHPVYSLWRRASQNFAEMAHGNITVLLNGSIGNAFNMKRHGNKLRSDVFLAKVCIKICIHLSLFFYSTHSMFASVEVDSLDPCRVDYVNIKMVTNLDGPFIESCNQGSVVDLIRILRSRGFHWTCTDNDE